MLVDVGLSVGVGVGDAGGSGVLVASGCGVAEGWSVLVGFSVAVAAFVEGGGGVDVAGSQLLRLIMRRPKIIQIAFIGNFDVCCFTITPPESIKGRNALAQVTFLFCILF